MSRRLGATKGRSSSSKCSSCPQESCALSLAARTHFAVRWVLSERNPSDFRSRGAARAGFRPCGEPLLSVRFLAMVKKRRKVMSGRLPGSTHRLITTVPVHTPALTGASEPRIAMGSTFLEASSVKASTLNDFRRRLAEFCGFLRAQKLTCFSDDGLDELLVQACNLMFVDGCPAADLGKLLAAMKPFPTSLPGLWRGLRFKGFRCLGLWPCAWWAFSFIEVLAGWRCSCL